VKLVDANVLLYAVNEDAPHHAAARAWLDEWLAGPDGPRNKEAPGAGFRGRTRGIDPGGVSRDHKTPH
jgi:hypothetical protein